LIIASVTRRGALAPAMSTAPTTTSARLTDSVKLRNAVRKWAKPLAVDSVLRGAWNVFFTTADHAHRESFMQLRPDQTQALLDELEPLVKKLLAIPAPLPEPTKPAKPARRR